MIKSHSAGASFVPNKALHSSSLALLCFPLARWSESEQPIGATKQSTLARQSSPGFSPSLLPPPHLYLSFLIAISIFLILNEKEREDIMQPWHHLLWIRCIHSPKQNQRWARTPKTCMCVCVHAHAHAPQRAGAGTRHKEMKGRRWCLLMCLQSPYQIRMAFYFKIG